MSIVSLGIPASSGTLSLDASGAEGMSSSSTQCPVVTHSAPPADGDDNIWKLQIQWNPASHAAAAWISDGNDLNPNGPQVLQLASNGSGGYAGVVLGRTPGAAGTAWNLSAAGAITDLTALPVRLSQTVGNATYYLCSPQPPADGNATTGQTRSAQSATIWTLQPVGSWATPATYAQFVVGSVTVQTLLTTLWNATVGTAWERSFAPMLIAWMYDYPNAFPGNPNNRWATDLGSFYNLVYAPYFVQKPVKPGFGTGTPPNAAPPGAPDPGE